MITRMFAREVTGLINKVLARMLYDERIRFYDLSGMDPKSRVPRSKVIQFYSAVNNIGNFTPVLGIRKIIQTYPDTWNIHDPSIDFDFINRSYSHAIIGGGGLLHPIFAGFWQRYRNRCRLPTVAWGIGVCLPDRQGDWSQEHKATVRQVLSRCQMVNVRDELTAEYFCLKNVDIGPCPTIVYLQDFSTNEDAVGQVLLSFHTELTSRQVISRLIKKIKRSTGHRVATTNNKQYRFCGLERIIRKKYCRSRFVVTTRLHGAIIAYGLGIPYLAIPLDAKIREFHRMYGNGVIEELDRIWDIDDLEAVMGSFSMQPIRTNDVLSFGQKVRQWLGLS